MYGLKNHDNKFEVIKNRAPTDNIYNAKCGKWWAKVLLKHKGQVIQNRSQRQAQHRKTNNVTAGQQGLVSLNERSTAALNYKGGGILQEMQLERYSTYCRVKIKNGSTIKTDFYTKNEKKSTEGRNRRRPNAQSRDQENEKTKKAAASQGKKVKTENKQRKPKKDAYIDTKTK